MPPPAETAGPATVAVVGVGAIGGYVAGALSEAGHRLVLCSRRPFDRLVVETASGTIVVDQPPALEPAEVGSEVGQVDWIVVATKAHDTAAAAAWLDRLRGPGTVAVVTLQNGLDPAGALAPLAAPTRVVPTIVLCGAESPAPGRVVHHESSRLLVPAAEASLVEPLFRGSRVEITAEADFDAAVWAKLVLNSVANPIAGLTGRRLEVFRDPDVAALALAVAEEGLAVARACGVEPAMSAQEIVDILRSADPAMGNSTLYDRLAGRRTECGAINGAIVRAGRDAGVPTPCNSTLLTLLEAQGAPNTA